MVPDAKRTVARAISSIATDLECRQANSMSRDWWYVNLLTCDVHCARLQSVCVQRQKRRDVAREKRIRNTKGTTKVKY